MTIKAGRADGFRTLAQELTTATRSSYSGCLAYTFHQQVDDPSAFILYEQWRNRAALDAHLVRLRAEYGPSPTGDGGLPALIVEYFEATRGVLYEVVA